MIQKENPQKTEGQELQLNPQLLRSGQAEYCPISPIKDIRRLERDINSINMMWLDDVMTAGEVEVSPWHSMFIGGTRNNQDASAF